MADEQNTENGLIDLGFLDTPDAAVPDEAPAAGVADDDPPAGNAAPQAGPAPQTDDAKAGDVPPADDPPAAGIDWSTVDPASIPDDVVSRSRAFRGLLTDKQREAQARQQLQEIINTQIAGRQQQAPPPEDDDPLAGVDPDGFIDRQALEKVLARQEKKHQQELQRLAKQQQDQRLAEQERQFLSSPMVKSLPPDLQPKAVFDAGLPELQRQNPMLVAALMQEPDPHTALFKAIVERVPAIRDRYVAHRQQQRSRTPNPQPRTPAAPPAAAPVSDDPYSQLLAGYAGVAGKTPVEAAAALGDDVGFDLEMVQEE
jgi:hypothetical protein